MINKIFLICLSFLFLGEAFAAESGGMPQLNPEFWISQIFWLTITFGVLYFTLSKFILPKISANLEIRRSQILENIEAAEKQKKETDQRIKDYEKIILNSKNEAKNYFYQAREKILKDINEKKEKLDRELEDEIKKAEIEIQEFKDKSSDKINKIAVETSGDLIHKFIGSEVNNSNISAIVDDISKKYKDKYHGN
tara:strand:+ start:50 stop:634 length:585 start_codon:yes stop_codon:yes gene_type:complete